MTSAEVEDVLDGFAQTARICVEAGLDGVELHGTHGYLLQQSFSPWGNRRDDGWGEQLAFARALILRVRQQIGREPVVGLRISTDDFMSPERGGLGVEALRGIACALVDTGELDYVSQSEGARRGTTRARSAATATPSASSSLSPAGSARQSAPACRSSPRAGSTIPTSPSGRSQPATATSSP